MQPTTLRRRVSYGVLCTAVVGSVLVPLMASAAPCASWTDPKGDATTGQRGVAALGDANLDIVAASFGTVGKNLVGTITTDGLSSASSDAGDEFRFRFTIAGQDVILYADRTAPNGTQVDVTVGFYNLTTDETGEATVEFDVKSKTVTLTGPLTELAKAVGKPVAGQAVTDLKAETLNQLLRGALAPAKYDDALSKDKPVVGTACTIKGASAAPAASPEPKASAAPSAGASAAPSAKPSAAASAGPSGSAAPSAAASAAPSASAAPPPPQPAVPVPAKGCFGFADKAGDGNAAVGPASAGNDNDLDILTVTGRSTDDVLAGHLGIAKLANGPGKPGFSGHRFEYAFKLVGKTVTLRADSTGAGTGLVDGTAAGGLVVKAVFDIPSSQVVLTVDRNSLAEVLKTPIRTGEILTETTGRSYGRTAATTTVADTAVAEDPERGRYIVGDNACFRPVLSVGMPAEVQTSDAALVDVVISTSDGRIAADQQVTGRVGNGRAVSATTNGRGVATLAVPVLDAAGVQDVVVRSSGSAGDGELLGTVRVVVERTVLALRSTGSGATRTVVATLTDDDRRTLSGQQVRFAFGGRAVTATTDRLGRARVAVPTGSTVDVTYAGRRGFLASTKGRVRT